MATKPSRRSGKLFGALALLGIGYCVSLPWQRAQWQRVEQLKSETATQEARLHDLTMQRQSAQQSEVAVKNAPESIEALFAFAETCVQRGDQARAAEALRTIEAKASPDTALLVGLSRVYQRMGWLDRALNHAEEAVKRDPKSVDALLTLAFLESHLGWLEAAWPHLKQAQDLDPNNPGILVAQALLHDQMGALDDVERALQAALKHRANDWQTQLLLARNQMAQKRFSDALKTLDTAETISPSQPALIAARTEALFGQNQLDAALGMAQKYAQLAPDSKDAHYWIGKVLLAKGDELGAIREWDHALAPRQGNPTLQINLGSLLVRHGQRERGLALLAEGKATRTSEQEYSRQIGIVRDDFQNPEAHRTFARWCRQQGRLPRAVIEWEQVLRLKPDDAEARKERDAALTAREEAVKRAPRSG